MVETKLILGDALKELPKLPDCSVDCIITDSPFGHNNNDGDLIQNREKVLTKEKKWIWAGSRARVVQNAARPIANDGPEANDLFKSVLPEFKRLLRTGGCCCCCCGGGGGPDPQFARWSMWIDEVLEFKQMVVWDKGPMGMGWHYRRSYETILVAMKPGGPCKWYDESDKIENIIRPGDYGIHKIIPGKEHHPTEKSVALAKHFIRLHTQPGDTVLDPFLGRGWTGVACKLMNRNFIGIEIDPFWFEKAKERIENTNEGLGMFEGPYAS